MSRSAPEPVHSGSELPDPSRRGLGGPPPWATMPTKLRRPISLDKVLAALAATGQLGASPGPPASDDLLAPWLDLLPADSLTGQARPGAVLVALFEEDGEARVVLTRRSAELRNHRGQVSFPGGRIDDGEDAATAALREAHEEIGLDPAEVRVVGWLHPLFTLNLTSFILPVVGVLTGRPSTVPNPAEVARVFDVALADLVADGIYHEETWDPYEEWSTTGPQAHQIWFFGVADERVWGATARVLHELALLALGIAQEG
jgi:8-oxo-dGTP pyrophosphatase MutT (NUDIX family)